jgi:hypothetical protein
VLDVLARTFSSLSSSKKVSPTVVWALEEELPERVEEGPVDLLGEGGHGIRIEMLLEDEEPEGPIQTDLVLGEHFCSPPLRCRADGMALRGRRTADPPAGGPQPKENCVCRALTSPEHDNESSILRIQPVLGACFGALTPLTRPRRRLTHSLSSRSADVGCRPDLAPAMLEGYGSVERDILLN